MTVPMVTLRPSDFAVVVVVGSLVTATAASVVVSVSEAEAVVLPLTSAELASALT